jgi:hypothetical protein
MGAEIVLPSMGCVRLTQGKYAIVDDQFYDALVAMGVAFQIRKRRYFAIVVCQLAGKPVETRIRFIDSNCQNCQVSEVTISAIRHCRIWRWL